MVGRTEPEEPWVNWRHVFLLSEGEKVNLGGQEGIQALKGSLSPVRERCDIWKMEEIQSECPGPFYPDAHFQLVGSAVIPSMRPRRAGNDKGELWLR